MGIALAMSECSRHVNNEIYCDMASYLLDNIMEKIHENLIHSFDSALSGIGWGIEYLVRALKNFIMKKNIVIFFLLLISQYSVSVIFSQNQKIRVA